MSDDESVEAILPGPVRLARRMGEVGTWVMRDPLRLGEVADVISLAGGLPAGETLPAVEIGEAVTQVVTSRQAVTALQYSSAEGLPELRAWIADRASADRGRPVDPGQVVVTAGGLQGLDVIARVLLDPGDLVAVEEPVFPGSLHCLEMYQPEFLAVPVDDDGMDVSALAERLAGGLRPKLVYTVATFHNPTGVTLSAPRRRELADLAERFEFMVVEDEPYTALRFRGDPLRPVAAYSDNVITIGSFSKTLGPGLRAGWVVVPPAFAGAVGRAKRWSDLHTSTLLQYTLVTLLGRDGWFDAHLARLPAVYGQRCAALRDAVARYLPGVLEVNDPAGGLFVWGRVVAGLSADDLLDAAIRAGVSYVCGPQFAVYNPDPATLRMSFAGNSPQRLELAARRLADAATTVLGR
ncbi:PLP-dependent aminotransferase family protein [Candidatus Protofrankia californiensis]|uniref:aminotransferase-like domain-containing protein n=1 Tax=Candidatus Protofrankia californiensis TaxID=1839754 RepID=UPI0013EC66A1|nr:PLP-dependent aminotransferase family protein [Candidatus Protofrankia californiensis]